MPLDANSLPPHLRGMPCTCRLLTPPQAELQHGAAEREQHATPRHRLQGERPTSGSYGTQRAGGPAPTPPRANRGKNCPQYKKHPLSGTREVIPCFMEREKAVSAIADVSGGWVLLLFFSSFFTNNSICLET